MRRQLNTSENAEEQDELLDLVDDLDHVIGIKKRSEVYKQGLTNFRVINAFIINSTGKLWIPQRSSLKNLFPLRLDASIGGHVKSGESYERALERELREELNIELINVKYSLLGHLTPEKDNVSAYMNVYQIKMDSAPNFNHEEILDSFWLKPEEVLIIAMDPSTVKDDLPKLIKLFFARQQG